MGWGNGIVLYLMIWWVALFAVLPWGIRVRTDPDPTSGWRGAPEHPRLIKTLIATTLVAAVIWLGAYWLITSPYLSFREGWLAMQPH